MPPLPQWFRGRAAIGAFLREGPFARPRWRLAPAHLNGQLSFTYLEQDGTPHAVDVLDLAPDGRIAAITAFLGPQDD